MTGDAAPAPFSSPSPSPSSSPSRRRAAWAAAVALAAAALVVVVCAVRSVTRFRCFTNDSMNYVDVARHVLAGDGCVQSTVGLHHVRIEPGATFPAPFTAQPPVFPGLVAAAAAPGLDPLDAALVVPCAALAAALAAAWLLGREIGGPAAALGAVGALLLFEPARRAATVAWSDVPALAFGLGSLALALRARRTGSPTHAALAGLAAGLAFATRYALLPFAPAAFVACLGAAGARARVRCAVAFAVPAAAISAAVALRNRAADGSWLGSERLPAHVGVSENVRRALRSLAEDALPGFVQRPAQILIVVAALAVAASLALRRRADRSPAERWGLLVPAAAAAYLVFLVAAASRSHVDAIDDRLVLPAGALLAAWTGATIWTRARSGEAGAAAFAVVAAGIAVAAVVSAERPTVARGAEARSARLDWIARHLTERDLVIGDDAVDVPFRHPGRRAVSFSPWPYSEHPTYERIRGFAAAHAGEFDRFFLVVRDHGLAPEGWRERFGPFVADLVHGDEARWPGIERVGRTPDGAFVLRLVP